MIHTQKALIKIKKKKKSIMNFHHKSTELKAVSRRYHYCLLHMRLATTIDEPKKNFSTQNKN